MLSVSEARARILEVFQPVEPQTVPLDRAAGRILSTEITAGTDIPPFDYSSVDGFALKVADTTAGRTLRVRADIRAGTSSEIVIHTGECVRIMTGAPLPNGAEAVIMLEDTDFNDRASGQPAPQTVIIHKEVRLGENVRRRGEDLHCGDIALTHGVRVRAQEMGLLAMLGKSEVHVYRRPRLGLLSSG
ncbi:MAG TPA: hypothetical protein VII93_08165, partial [Anaerolineales bacterium]